MAVVAVVVVVVVALVAVVPVAAAAVVLLLLLLVTSWKACVQCQCPQKRADAETMFGQRAKHCLHGYLDCELS